MIARLRKLYFAALIVLSLIQVIAFSKPNNLVCVSFVGVSLCVVLFITARRSNFESVPLSSFVVLVFATVNLFIPLLGTTIEGKPLIYNLKIPETTFGYMGASAVVLSLAHAIYRRVQWIKWGRERISHFVMTPVGLFSTPSPLQLWIMGFIGCGALVVGSVFFSSKTIEVNGFVPQLINGFRPLSGAPFLLPVGAYFFGWKKLTKMQWAAFSLYALALMGASMALGARGTLGIPVASFVFCFGLAACMNRWVFNPFQPRFLTPALLVIFLGMPILGYLTTAMRIARYERVGMSAGERVMNTLSVMTDYDRVSRYWTKAAAEGVRAGVWEENYLSNEIFQRMTMVKFADNCFYFSRDFGPQDRKNLDKFMTNRFWAVFPSPLLRVFGIYYNKWRSLSMSIGDFILYARTSFDYAALRTASIVATGPAQYGLWFFLLFPIVGIVVFSSVDCFCKNIPTRAGTYFAISPLFLIEIYLIAQVFNAEAFVSILTFLIRTLPQMTIIYMGVYYATSVFRRPAVAPAKKVAAIG